jgi:hypothetical protein
MVLESDVEGEVKIGTLALRDWSFLGRVMVRLGRGLPL